VTPLHRILALRHSVPGYQQVYRLTLRTLRFFFRHIRRWRIWAVLAGTGGDVAMPSLGIGAGAHLRSPGTATLPIVALLALDCPEKVLSETLDRIATAQVLSGGFRVLVVSDRPVFAVTRKHGYPLELLVSQQDLATAQPGADWDDYVLGQVRDIVRDYGVRAVVPVQGLVEAPWPALLAFGAMGTVTINRTTGEWSTT
jgi:hypothetical protein